MNHDPREVLGVPPNASMERCRKAHRKLVMDLHPDRNPGDAEAERRFKEVQAAWDRLNGRGPETVLLESHAVANLCNLFVQVTSDLVHRGIDPSTRDLKGMMKTKLQEHKRDAHQIGNDIAKQLGFFKGMLGRWKAGDAPTPLEEVLLAKVRDGDGLLEKVRHEEVMVDASLRMLEEWTYDHIVTSGVDGWTNPFVNEVQSDVRQVVA